MREADLAYQGAKERFLAGLREGTWSDDQAFSEFAISLFHYQTRFNLPYRRYCESLNGLAPRHWREITAVPTDAFKQAELFVFPTSRAGACFETSGTTGERRGRHYFQETEIYDRVVRETWNQLDGGFASPKLLRFALTPSPASSPHSSLSHMMGVLVGPYPDRFLIDEAGQFRLDPLRGALDKGHPVLIMGTALAYLRWMEQAGDSDWELPQGSYCLETGGYKGTSVSYSKEALYALFERFLGVPRDHMVNEYGMTELSSQFYTSGIGRPHWGPAWTRALVVDPSSQEEVELGGVGYLRIYDLANIASVLAIETQDLAQRTEEGFLLLGRDPKAIDRGCSRAADEMLQG